MSAATDRARAEAIRREERRDEIEAKLRANVENAAIRAAAIDCRIDGKLEAGEITPEQAEESRRHPTTRRALGAPAREERILQDWLEQVGRAGPRG